MHYQDYVLPTWLPEAIEHYLQHTELGVPIRSLARSADRSASTVLRQIRKVESKRDDPLVDAALQTLSKGCTPCENAASSLSGEAAEAEPDMALPETAELKRESVRVLRRLCETGALLAVAEKMEKAVVVRDDHTGSPRTATVDTAVAQAMALKGWISCNKPGRISRYFVTPAGRTALSRLLAEQENRLRAEQEIGFGEAAAGFTHAAPALPERPKEGPITERRRRVRYNLTESPLLCLSRRKDRDGRRFLEDPLVRAGERLREDFELAQMGPNVGQNWQKFLSGGARGPFEPDKDVAHGPSGARARVACALTDLGPGLCDVALRCCCYLEGLETAEKKLGWSARSGKIVLRIALQRLSRHYQEQSGQGQMIG